MDNQNQPGKIGTVKTPAAKWRENGDHDPHGDTYDCERAALLMGHLR